MTFPSTGKDYSELLDDIFGKDVSMKIREVAPTIQMFAGLTSSDLANIPSVGKSRARMIKSVIQLSTNIHKNARSLTRVSGPDDIFDLFGDMAHLDREHFRSVILNTKNRILGIKTISIGSLNSSFVHSREVFKSAIELSAQAIVLVHNHPSGICDPSPEDITVTHRLEDAGKIIGINVLDHVIIGHDSYYSMSEMGQL